MNGIKIGKEMSRTIEALVASIGGKRPRVGNEIVALAWAEKRVVEMTKSGELYLHSNWKKIIKCLIKAQVVYMEYCRYSYLAEDEEVEREWWDVQWNSSIDLLTETKSLFQGGMA